MTNEAAALFPVVVEVPVAWGEMDAYGHVNNAVYLRWFETARIEYFRRAQVEERMKTEHIGPILARATVDYRRPVVFPDTVRVEARVPKLGTTSFTMTYRLTSQAQGAVAAEGDSVVVMVDYRSGAKVPLDDLLRQRIADIEAGR
jgi:acyl-CoA thioester hydrolase